MIQDHDDEMDAMLEQLKTAGLIEVYTDEDGIVTYRLTPEGARMRRRIAMTGDDSPLDAILDADE